MFSAVSNLGAGGLSDITLSDTSNGVLYGTFAITGLVSGAINNRAWREPDALPLPSVLTRLCSAWSAADALHRHSRLRALRRLSVVVSGSTH